MMNHRKFFIVILAIVAIGCSCAIFMPQKFALKNPARNVTLAGLFTDHMVLQRNMPIPIWGKADANGELLIQFKDQTKLVSADLNGRWRIDLEPEPAGGPFDMHIIGIDTLKLTDVMVGDVWIASGQSNMEWPMSRVNHAEEEIDQADHFGIRLLSVPRKISFIPLEDTESDGWHVCSPRTVGNFSAVAYFFGREIHQTQDIPVGLINTSWGGTPAEAWMSEPALVDYPHYLEMIGGGEMASTDPESLQVFYERLTTAYEKGMQDWLNFVIEHDQGMGEQPWFKADYDASDWHEIDVPGIWEDAEIGNYDGIIWFRKEIEVPASWRDDSLSLELGPIDDNDDTYLNGVLVGSTQSYNTDRVYRMAGERLRSGKNIIVVRVLDNTGNGGFWGKPEQMKLVSGKGDILPLAGTWTYKYGVNPELVPPKGTMPRRPHYLPTVLYNSMIYPLLPYAIRGAIWYQGESNAGAAYEYRSLFPAMIRNWRNDWAQGDFPFYYVQLANYRAVKEIPVESDWAELREAQLMTLELENTGMAVIIDIGEADDIHPRNKQDVGKRLALNARHHDYDEDIEYSGPIYKSHVVENDEVRLFFDHRGSGLVAKGEAKLKGFAIAGADRTFHWADARIEGESVVVSSPEVAQPVAVRYAWADNPICNLFNEEGLPASPFRTDDWPGITQPMEIQSEK
ncbi:9-O-acetylesterase [candidate division KSB1 bacterium]|nr:9-O-acetylesterase [candidate division KSB1 bacterium]